MNDSGQALRYWAVYDRTANERISTERWTYDSETKTLTVREIKPWHKYTVSFLSYRIWKEISMYNYTTNHWDKEHLCRLIPGIWKSSPIF